jgi:hypothetical protein
LQTSRNGGPEDGFTVNKAIERVAGERDGFSRFPNTRIEQRPVVFGDWFYCECLGVRRLDQFDSEIDRRSPVAEHSGSDG